MQMDDSSFGLPSEASTWSTLFLGPKKRSFGNEMPSVFIDPAFPLSHVCHSLSEDFARAIKYLMRFLWYR